MDTNPHKLIHISSSKIYRVNGVTFEWHSYLGPIVLNRHTGKERPFRSISCRNWSAVEKFQRMSEDQKDHYRIV